MANPEEGKSLAGRPQIEETLEDGVPVTQTEELSIKGYPTVDVTAHGADPTDPTVDDTAAFNDAIDEAVSLGGGIVRLPNGDLSVDSLGISTLNDSEFKGLGIIGQGIGSTRLHIGDSFGFGGSNLSESETLTNIEIGKMSLNVDLDSNGLLWTSNRSYFHDLDITGRCNNNPLYHGSYYHCKFENIRIHDIIDIGYAGAWDFNPNTVTMDSIRTKNLNKATLWPNGGENLKVMNSYSDGELLQGEGRTIGVDVINTTASAINPSTHSDVTVRGCQVREEIGTHDLINFMIEQNIIHRETLGTGIKQNSKIGGEICNNTLINAQIDVSQNSVTDDCRYRGNRLRFPDTNPSYQILNSSAYTREVSGQIFLENDFEDGIAKFADTRGIKYEDLNVNELKIGFNGARIRVNSDGDVEVVNEDGETTTIS